MHPIKILVTGATGMLGIRILKLLKSNPAYHVFSIGRSGSGSDHITCDITDIEVFAGIIEKLCPDYIVHCAANTDIQHCEKEKDYTYKLHVLTSRLIASCTNLKKSVFISTDSVFDGSKGDYKENDFIAPLNYYALTKALAEECFINASHPSIVLRTNMFGFNEPAKSSLFEWAWNSLNQGKEISGYNNVFFNPLYVGTIAQIIVAVLENDITGLLHIGSSEALSKYAFIQKIADIFDFPRALIKPFQADDKGVLKRPLNTTLNTQYFQETSGITLPDIDIELMKLAGDFKKQIIDQL